jgi:hypothetical protein
MASIHKVIGYQLRQNLETARKKLRLLNFDYEY